MLYGDCRAGIFAQNEHDKKIYLENTNSVDLNVYAARSSQSSTPYML